MTSHTDIRRYSIESGIPIAPGKAIKAYPFIRMEVGQSFALDSNNHSEVMRVKQAAIYWQKAHAPMKFAVRMDANRNYRCWRTA